MFLLSLSLKHFVKQGTLKVVDCRGTEHVFTGSKTGPEVTIRFHNKLTPWKVAIAPDVYLGEAYMDGTLTVDDGRLYDFIDLATRNIGLAFGHKVYDFIGGIRRAFLWLSRHIPIYKSKSNVAHHYDLSDELYELFLDDNRQYSCAYFEHPDQDLETAQLRKMSHIAAKLCIEKEQKILDIGCGWGGLGIFLAKTCDAEVKGITLSEEQLAYANARSTKEGMAKHARFYLEDYRQIKEKFDRIVSVGMFEHVGRSHYGEFFKIISKLLQDDGVALLHTIGRAQGPNATNPWLKKHIFPGGYMPALSEVTAAIEKAGLYITDVEILRLHYAETAKAWRQRFAKNRDKAKEIYDERFCRMWEFYLASAEGGFRNGGLVVFQIQMAKKQDAVPLTRSYIDNWKAKTLPHSDVAS